MMKREKASGEFQVELVCIHRTAACICVLDHDRQGDVWKGQKLGVGVRRRAGPELT
ncbi:hypothetical protein BDU57DRAFT_518307 [Ampelomyces quisqualis]|uniref:Uncharacterized protein n=1 Tax=Ampelomyces quisqualis TaxID=50730 RepID=A0A6A5QLL5_AMPQU|nr:hypothetical protein BDU57DRAFT_518307 [Ampelomyces quisqualis]